MGYILALAIYLLLIGFVLFSAALSLFVGLVVSVFVGIFHAVKNCIVGIDMSVTSKFMKVILFITVGIVVLIIVAFFILTVII